MCVYLPPGERTYQWQSYCIKYTGSSIQPKLQNNKNYCDPLFVTLLGVTVYVRLSQNMILRTCMMTVEAACSLYVDGPWLGLLLYVDVSPSSELNGWANQYGCVGGNPVLAATGHVDQLNSTAGSRALSRRHGRKKFG